MDNIIKYIDNWVIDGTIMNGELNVNKNNGEIELTLYHKNETYINFNKYYEHITTDENSYNSITLLKCYYMDCKDSYSEDHIKDEYILKFKYRFQVLYCIDNYLLENNEIKFDIMGFNISHLFYWGDTSKYEINSDGNHDFILHSKIIEKQTIYSCDDYTIYYRINNRSHSIMQGLESYTLSQYPLILIESKEKTIDFYIDIINKIVAIMKIAIGKNIFIHDIIGGIQKRSYNIYHNIPKESYTSEYLHFKLFCMSDLFNFSRFETWLSIYNDIEMIVNIYCDNITNKYTSIENKFINTVTALESYHSKFICKGDSNINKFIDEFKIRKGEKIFDILFKDIITNKSNQITLRMRLLDLLRNMITVFKIGSSEDEFSKRVVDTRNYLVHGNDYNKNIYKKTELYMINDFLMQILCFYIIKELNFNEILFKSIVREIKQRHCMYLHT